LNDEEGSTLPIAAATAWMALNWMRPIGNSIKGKDTVVLLQGTGGVSMAGLQIAKANGLTGKVVYQTFRSKTNRVKQLSHPHPKKS
jgi:NADPH:quinone reductase-like Zn-dependent oxidoreductase